MIFTIFRDDFDFKREFVNGPCPSDIEDYDAAEHAIGMGGWQYMEAWNQFLDAAFADTDEGRALAREREQSRAPHRTRAWGRSGIGSNAHICTHICPAPI
jgi:hypothetical protein